MTTPQFLAWLDGKMAEHGGEKVIPPAPVIAASLTANVAKYVESNITERVLKKAHIAEQVADVMRKVLTPDEDILKRDVSEWLIRNPHQHWADRVAERAYELANEHVE